MNPSQFDVPIVVFSVSVFVAGVFLNSCGSGTRHGYQIEDGQVILYTGFPAQRTVLLEADARTFQAIRAEYGTDKTHVYYRNQAIAGADPTTFTYLAGSYAKDHKRGYYQNQPISDEGSAFAIVPNPEETPAHVTATGIAYARDNQRVYKGTRVLGGADPATFTFVPMFNGTYLTRDARHVYANDEPLAGVNSLTFVRMSAMHFTDGQNVWGLALGQNTHWQIIPEADVRTFKGAGTYYARDKRRVYFGSKSISSTDPATFQETGYLLAKDKNRTYQSDQVVTP
ncbi:hypothetical protein GCM10027341_35410 [Spirosoma knui]